jgi:eukaryotic translation initiation factor 2C
MSKLSITPSKSSKTTIDGHPLEMDPPVKAPMPNPQPGNRIDPALSKQVLKDAGDNASTAEFPLRKTLHATNTTVFTNHFAIKLDPKVPLYKYHVEGLPDKMGQKKARIMLHDMIEKTPFLKDNQDKFVTDYKCTLISWIRLPEEARGPFDIGSHDTYDLVRIRFTDEEQLGVDLLKQYVEGKAQPQRVSSSVRHCVALAH